MEISRFSGTAQNSVLHQEAIENAKVAARRARAEERRERLLDARQRTIGVDVNALDRQIAEKEAQLAKEKEAEQQYLRQQQHVNRAVTRWERQREEERLRRERETKEYQKIQQEHHKLTETHGLNDRTGLRSELPARLDDDDPRCGPSSMQRFDGEDLHAAERAALQAAQLRTWCEIQQKERLSRQEAEKVADRQYANMLERVGNQRDEYMKQVERERRDQLRNTAEYNAKIASDRQAQAEEEKRLSRSEEDRYRELNGLLDERFEDGDASNTLGPGRIRRDHYRGMTEDQKRQYLVEIERQIEEKKAAQAARKEAEKAMDNVQVEALRAVARFDAQRENEARRRKTELREELERQRAEAAERKRQEKEENARAGFDDGFFGRFGTSDR